MHFLRNICLLIGLLNVVGLPSGIAQTYDTLYTNGFETPLNESFNITDDTCTYIFERTTNRQTVGNYSLTYQSGDAKAGCAAAFQSADQFSIKDVNPKDSFFIQVDFYKSAANSIPLPGDRGEGMTVSLRTFAPGPGRAPNLFVDFFARYVDSVPKAPAGWHTFTTDTFTGKSIRDQTLNTQFFLEYAALAGKGGADMYMDEVKVIRYRNFEPTIELKRPNGGEEIEKNTTYEIRWKALGPVAQVNLAYSANGGDTWNPIQKNVDASAGKYQWNVPDKNTEQGLIRVRSAGNTAAEAISEEPFSIIDKRPELTLTAPNGSEKLDIATRYTIEWTRFKVSKVDLAYREFEQWNTIDTSVNAAKGSYEWVVPDANRSLDIRIRDAAGSAAGDTVFSVRAENGLSPEVALTQPRKNDEILTGTLYDIKWVANSRLAEVNIDFKPNPDSSWQDVATGISAGNEAYKWRAPVDERPDARLRIVAGNSSSTTDVIPVTVTDQLTATPSLTTVPTLKVYPNPAGKQVSIALPSSAQNSLSAITVTGLEGKTYQKNAVRADAKSITLDISELPSGMYILQIEAADTIYTKRLLKR